MTEKFKVGDHVTWNSEAGHVSGRIIKVPSAETRNISFSPSSSFGRRRTSAV